MKSIPWVRCASGNVCISGRQICNISKNLICISFKFAFSDLLQIGSKFGHCVTFLVTLPWNAFLTSTWHIYITVSNLVMRCYHFHIWPPDDTTCASCKVGHLMAPLALSQSCPPDGATCIAMHIDPQPSEC